MVPEEKVLLTVKSSSPRFPVIPALFIFILYLSAGCGNDIHTVNAYTIASTSPRMSAKKIDVLFTDSGRIEARLTSNLINSYSGEDPYMEFPKGFRILFFDSAMRVESTITGNYGKRRELAHTMEAKGNVVVKNEIRNRTLNTEHLIWDENKHMIYSDVDVKFTTPDKVLYGQRFESNETFTRYKIIQVKAIMTVAKDTI
jgi:LPS export ABC transporter protein LptC